MKYLFEQEGLIYLESSADSTPKIILVAPISMLDANLTFEIILDSGDDGESENPYDDEGAEDGEDISSSKLLINIIGFIRNEAQSFQLAIQYDAPVIPMMIYGIIMQFIEKFERCPHARRLDLLEAASILTVDASVYNLAGEQSHIDDFTSMIKKRLEAIKLLRQEKDSALN